MESDLERRQRIAKWIVGYQILMRGGLSSVVHVAATKQSQIDDNTFAHISVDDVEWLFLTQDDGKAEG